MRWSATLFALTLLAGTSAIAQPAVSQVSSSAVAGQGCDGITYNVVVSPDGSTLSVLFDNMSVSGGASAGLARTVCSLQVPLALPEGYSLGLYKVDYRGFARLPGRQVAELNIDYGLNASGRGRQFRHTIRGPYEDDYLVSETIGAGLMARIGCGSAALLTLNAAIALDSRRAPGESFMSLDTADGASQGAVVFHLDRKKCRGGRTG